MLYQGNETYCPQARKEATYIRKYYYDDHDDHSVIIDQEV